MFSMYSKNKGIGLVPITLFPWSGLQTESLRKSESLISFIKQQVIGLLLLDLLLKNRH